MYSVRPIRTPLEPARRSPPRSRAPRRGPRPRTASPPRLRVASLPSRERIDSASLEATPRQEGQTAFPLARPPYGGIKYQPLLHSARVRRRQAAIPHSGCDRSPVRQLRSLLRHSGRCGDTVGTCDAVQDVLGTAPATVLPTSHTSFKLSPPWSPRTAWARPSEAAPALTSTRPWPAGPSERRHATPGGRYPLQQRPRRPLELQGRRRDLRKAKDDAQDDCHARRHTPQYTFHSARPLRSRDLGRRRRLPQSPVHVHRLSLCL